jgi:glutamate/tyrosine decarboxylase-like PLP-dependent enzyme
VSPAVHPEGVRRQVAGFDLEGGADAGDTLDAVVDLLAGSTVLTTHPRYFGLFNPSPLAAGIAADVLAAGFNPQLAAWSHAPAAVEIEAHVIRQVGAWAGLPATAGSFTSGGAEANATAVLLALQHRFPTVRDGGTRALPAQPVFYASEQSHLAWLKIAHQSGLGRDAVRLVPVDSSLRLDLAALQRRIAEDRAAGAAPFMVVGTAGTTAAGAIDPLPELADVAHGSGLWFHVDAACAGAAVVSERLRPTLAGIERSDSVTIDAHKWFSVPMGAGMLLTPHAELLPQVFDVTTSYMPAPSISATPDPYTTSMQWSRRAAGLKLFLALAVYGREGYARQVEQDVALAERLREALVVDGWSIANDTPLPLVCVTDPAHADDPDHHRALAGAVVASGEAWISTVQLGDRPALRICIISHRTTPEDVDAVVTLLAQARSRAGVTTAVPAGGAAPRPAPDGPRRPAARPTSGRRVR